MSWLFTENEHSALCVLTPLTFLLFTLNTHNLAIFLLFTPARRGEEEEASPDEGGRPERSPQ